MMRIILLALTNFAVMAVLFITMTIIGKLFGIDMSAGSMGGILMMAVVFGFGGAFISLFMSKWMAKRSMGVQIIDNPQTAQERWLVETVRRQAEKSGIGMPEVGIFYSPDPNAFATGANRNNALVAVSQGLLDHMTADEVEAVLGHEIGHIANGDMVTQTLLQGVLNTFVIIFARLIGLAVDNFFRSSDEESSGPGWGYFIGSIIAEIFLGFVATAIVMWFSRHREFKADIAGADLAGRQKMINALKRLQSAHAVHDLPGEMAAFGIAGGLGDGLRKVFMTHPPLEDRIAALENMR
ncbi:MAG TPA: protease HtpX [Candidatus Thiothrix moscowensis]|uniref:protease HtpX n=1 Tax=unclassified Thiothrix TaxID=2636184 RepID=UPI0025E70355|nr:MULTISPECIES: protease HtpX [unclassified Thiothrix]HRJ53580.1 protease HtpX [Candidatus Thiothrix moscowensis]HRJ93612.1 protease HtpX [Candidatus Thiothrix moscowensis]